MTLLSVRLDDEVSDEIDTWSHYLGVSRSDLVRDALRHHLVTLTGERDSEIWEEHPLDENDLQLSDIADLGPTEDWSDWHDAAG
ncbi:MAG: CopG family transcriptional regulator [Acidimicrobiia bacterium]|nr:CopG family transcriptional regulator [Actinomycetota bacterium]MBL6924703.1 CopG family transcriptional regulator [Acidimicrobiia bacterium]MBL6927338.1 CopG family transcriptional regulator [Acidimicrobiia bacterium]